MGIQLFRERLSEEVHATNPKGIAGGFEFAVLERNLKEKHERPYGHRFANAKESSKSRFSSYSVRDRVLIIPHITFRDCRVYNFADNLSLNSFSIITLMTIKNRALCH